MFPLCFYFKRSIAVCVIEGKTMMESPLIMTFLPDACFHQEGSSPCAEIKADCVMEEKIALQNVQIIDTDLVEGAVIRKFLFRSLSKLHIFLHERIF
jgi:hypothetical protein